MTYTHISQVPKRRQWEANSAPNQPYNCGPTSAAFIADFYRDATFGIEATRDLAAVHDGDGTSAAEQATMLIKRGVPATVQRPTMAQLTSLVASGTRPVIVGMMMSIVSAAIRGHSFGGLHAVVLRQNAVGTGTFAGIPGKLVMDPNFDYGMTADPFNGARFYPDSVINAARTYDLGLRSAVVPTSPKAVAGADAVTEVTPATVFPVPRTALIAAGAKVDGWSAQALVKTQTWPNGSNFPTDCTVTIKQNPAKAPSGTFYRCTAGVYAGLYIPIGQVTLAPAPEPPGQVDLYKAYNDGVAAASAKAQEAKKP